MSNKTALKEFIEDILSGKVIDTLANDKYYLEKEKKQIISAFDAGQDACGYSESEGILYNSDSTEYFNNTYKKD